MDLALLLVGAPLLCVPAPAALVQFAHELQCPDAVILGPRVEQLHVVADELDAGRVQLHSLTMLVSMTWPLPDWFLSSRANSTPRAQVRPPPAKSATRFSGA